MENASERNADSHPNEHVMEALHAAMHCAITGVPLGYGNGTSSKLSQASLESACFPNSPTGNPAEEFADLNFIWKIIDTQHDSPPTDQQATRKTHGSPSVETADNPRPAPSVEPAAERVPLTSTQLYLRATDQTRLRRLGFHLRYGSQPPAQNLRRSTFHFARAAVSGCQDSVAALAVASIFGIGTYLNKNKALALLRFATRQGSVDALEIRALCCMDATFDDERSYSSCLELLAMGVARNSPSCLLWTGFCFDIGLGAVPDKNVAKQAYLAAGKSTSLSSMVYSSFPGALTAKDPWMLLKMALFFMYCSRQKTRMEHAMDCLRHAASLGLADAQVYFAICLLHGKGLRKNIPVALYWLREAADETPSHPVARRVLAQWQ